MNPDNARADSALDSPNEKMDLFPNRQSWGDSGSGVASQ